MVTRRIALKALCAWCPKKRRLVAVAVAAQLAPQQLLPELSFQPFSDKGSLGETDPFHLSRSESRWTLARPCFCYFRLCFDTRPKGVG